MSSRLIACLLVVGLVAVGCGSSGPSESAGGSVDPDAVAESADFGTMTEVCHEATGENRPGDHGVTADSIRITTISDAGSDLQAGLNQELWDAATVFTRWCNDHGGINGRRIELVQGDAQVTRYAEVIDQACDTSFALVGGGGALDDTGQEARIECGLPAVPGFVASREAREAELSYPALATGSTEITNGALMWLKATSGEGPVATVYGDFPTTEFTSRQRLAAAQAIGLATADSPVNTENNTYPVTGLDDWRPVASSVLDSGARGLLFSGQPPDLGKLLTAIASDRDDGDALEWIFGDENMYDETVIRSGRVGLAELPLYVQSFIHPFEAAGRGVESLAMDQFLALFDHYLPNGKSHAMFAVSGFASWLLFTQAASACGDELTRDCLVEQLRQVGEFDAGGLIAPRNPSDPTRASRCFVLLEATPDGFVIVEDEHLQPTDGVFNCSETNVATVRVDPAGGDGTS